MNSQLTKFGIVVCVSPGDYLFGKGTCASIRYFMPDTPIAVLVDGSVDTKTLEKTYQHLTVIRRENIDDPWLRQHSFGWGITKMLAFFYAPFEYFLYLDSDTVLWGNICNRIDPTAYHYIADTPNHPQEKDISTEEVSTWFFDPEFVENTFPEFPWQQYCNQFMCPGVFFGSCHTFTLAEYKEILELKIKNPYSLHFGDMGFHNLMVFKKFHENQLKLGFADFQVIFPEFPPSELQQRFSFEAEQPKINPGDEQILHMPDKKPLVNNSECYAEPMTYFRLQFLKDSEGLTGEAAMQRLLKEDQEYFRLRQQALFRKRLGVIKKLLGGNRAEWKRMIQRLSH